VFITPTVLDFVQAFAREEPRSAMVDALRKECRRTRSRLYAYVVMPHHIHMLLRLPEQMTQRKFMERFKPASSALVKPLLTEEEIAAFSDQIGLNRNTFWQRSFRGLVVETPKVFSQKVAYIHSNPVRAGYVERPEEYMWSSAPDWASGLYDDYQGLNLDPR
jgi:putative transposase